VQDNEPGGEMAITGDADQQEGQVSSGVEVVVVVGKEDQRAAQAEGPCRRSRFRSGAVEHKHWAGVRPTGLGLLVDADGIARC